MKAEEGFSCSLDVIQRSTKAFDFFSCEIVKFLVIKTLYPDPELDPGDLLKPMRIHNTV